MSDEIKTTGRAELIKHFTDLAQVGRVHAIVSCEASTGQIYREKKGGMVTVSRTAGENIKALRGQAKNSGRNPLFIDRAQRGEGQRLWNKAVDKFIRSKVLADIDEGAMAVARIFIGYVRDHIIKNQDKTGGPMRPVTPSVQKQKEREMPGVPPSELTPLRWTGQLLRSLIPRARRGR